ncbi:iron-containing alcohol dehydrogenase, partial [Desulforudis sp. 1190]|uniref:iron-containing alcohol dehydrogenase n=1 Tax=Desulforudis sp. 1190 TaxID=3416136 RepID=UPI003CF4A88B
MMFDILLPTRVLFGPGSTYRLGEEISRIGKRALVITGRRSLAESGQVERITNPLQIAKVETVWFRVDPEPTVDTVDEARRLIHEEKVDLVVGVGGGSALDVAKAAAGPVWRGIMSLSKAMSATGPWLPPTGSCGCSKTNPGTALPEPFT